MPDSRTWWNRAALEDASWYTATTPEPFFERGDASVGAEAGEIRARSNRSIRIRSSPRTHAMSAAQSVGCTDTAVGSERTGGDSAILDPGAPRVVG